MSDVKRKICLVTGSRSEYGLSRPILRAILKCEDLALQLVVTGMHLLPEYGNTIDLVKNDGFNISAAIETLGGSDNSGKITADGVGRCMLGLSDFFEKQKPDIVVAMTDLGHTLAAATCASYMNIPVAHVHGGDISGTVDDSVRHAITKLSHIHFVASQKSAERVIRMGEEPWRVHVVGAPGLDDILQGDFLSKGAVSKRFDLDAEKPYIVFVQHPASSEIEEAGEHYRRTLQAIYHFQLPIILIYPNSDAGSEDIIKVIEEQRKKNIAQLKIFRNLPRQEFLSLLKHAAVLVGNSSIGIIDAPSFHLPAVDIGTRQQNRERAENVLHTNYDAQQIKEAIRKSLYDMEFRKRLEKCVSPYGDGTAGLRIAEILGKVTIDEKLLKKQITY